MRPHLLRPLPVGAALALPLAAALAQPARPAVPTDLGEGAVLAARAVHFASPWPYDWMRDAAPLSTGVLVTVATDPALARPTQALNPVLMADAAPVAVLWIAPDARCLVGVAPSPADARVHLYWSPGDRLPEQIDVADAADRYLAALLAGVPARPLPFGPEAHGVDDGALRALVAEAKAACR